MSRPRGVNGPAISAFLGTILWHKCREPALWPRGRPYSMPDIVRNDDNALMVVWPRWYNRVLISALYLFFALTSWSALQNFRGKPVFQLNPSQLLEAFIFASFFIICIFGLVMFGARHTIVFDKRLKRVEAHSTLLLNFGRRHTTFRAVAAVTVVRVSLYRAPDIYNVRLTGLQNNKFITLGIFIKERKALAFAEEVSRAIATKITYGGFWGFGRTGPER